MPLGGSEAWFENEWGFERKSFRQSIPNSVGQCVHAYGICTEKSNQVVCLLVWYNFVVHDCCPNSMTNCFFFSPFGLVGCSTSTDAIAIAIKRDQRGTTSENNTTSAIFVRIHTITLHTIDVDLLTSDNRKQSTRPQTSSPTTLFRSSRRDHIRSPHTQLIHFITIGAKRAYTR